MKEVISLHIGQAGVQLGTSAWELFCLEHSIQLDGRKQLGDNDICGQGHQRFFSEDQAGKFVPRSIFIDLEPNVIDQIQTSAQKDLYNSELMVSGNFGATGSFAKGRYSFGSNIIDSCIEKIRKTVENCADFQGFLIYDSISGGTGSGLGSLLREKLSSEYSNKQKLDFAVFPSPSTSKSPLESFNSVLTIPSLMNNTDSTIVFDNTAIYDICQNNLNIAKPTFKDLNRIIAQAISSLTSFIRFEASLYSDLAEFHKNLVPYPFARFLIPSQSPIIPASQKIQPLSLDQLTKSAFSSSSLLAKCDQSQGRFLACSYLYRGEVIPKYVSRSFGDLKNSNFFKFVKQYPPILRVGIDYSTSCTLPEDILASPSQTLFAISNTSAISQVFQRISYDFNTKNKQKEFEKYLIDGMEQEELLQAIENLAVLEDKYNIINTISDDENTDN